MGISTAKLGPRGHPSLGKGRKEEVSFSPNGNDFMAILGIFTTAKDFWRKNVDIFGMEIR